MSNNVRDKKFHVFAHLLLDEICNVQDGMFDVSDWWKANVHQIIARRAYDLAKHAAFHIDEKDCDVLGFDEAVGRIPDMTEWPDEEDNEWHS